MKGQIGESMRKWLKFSAILLFMIFILPGLIYLGLAIYYQDSFMYGTWINGIYCTGKTIQEVAEELEKDFSYEEVKIYFQDEEKVLNLSELEVSFDFISALEQYRKRQNPYNWYMKLLGKKEEQEFFPKISFKEEKLKNWIEATDIYQGNLNLKEDCLRIVWSELGYSLKEEKALIFNVPLAMEVISSGLIQGEKTIDLMKEGCFFYRDETIEMQEIRDYFQKIQEFQSKQLVYKIKEIEKKIQPQELGSFLETDENGIPKVNKKGEFILVKSKIEEFVSQLARDYDSWHNYQFITHDGKEIFLTKGNYGTQINQKKEVDFLIKWLVNSEKTIREPEYLKDFTYQDKNKIDTTYIEIDMTIQKMFYFIDGVKILDTDVVTGCTKQKMGTPEMVCYIQSKSRNAILTGANYRSFVNYWMPVYGGIGIHDASWRDEFGGQIYIKSGSHGCINTPLERMADLFEMVEKGTPVVIHY